MLSVPHRIPSPRLVVRRFTTADRDAFVRFMTDPEATRFLSFPPEMRTAAAAEELLGTTIDGYESDDAAFAFAVADLAGPFVGMCGLNPLGDGEVEIFYAVTRARWGRGLGTEIALAVSRYALLDPEIRSLTAFIVPGHVASEKVARHAGFRYDGLADNPNFAEPVGRWVLTRDAVAGPK